MKKNLLAFLFGVLLTGALPPVHILPLALFGLGGFFLLARDAGSLKEAFRLGWFFGFGHFLTGLYWISFALFVDIEKFWWLFPFAMIGIPLIVAFYMAFVALLFKICTRYFKGWCLVIIFACIWTIIEMLRGILFTGFPWNLVGYIWTLSDYMLQFASIAGVWGLSLLAVIIFTMPAILFTSDFKLVEKINLSKLYPVLFSGLFLVIVFAWGGYRVYSANDNFVAGVKFRIVQANIPQNVKWETDWQSKTIQKYFDLTMGQGFEDITHVVWPETALPLVLTKESPILNVIKNIVPKDGALITGALRASYDNNGRVNGIFNSIVAMTRDKPLYNFYDKRHLVPFGEYVPFRSILPIDKITSGSIDFSVGMQPSTMQVPGLQPFAGLVCYEAIFPGSVVDKDNRPHLMINVTNDAWYGKTSGPYQHMQMARTRAVEEGIPLIRAANNGISIIVDSYGRILHKTKLGETDVIDSFLPVPILGDTIYGRYGSVVITLSMVVLLLISCGYAIFHGDSRIKML